MEVFFPEWIGSKDYCTFYLFILCFFLDGDLENHDVSQLPKETLDIIEADSFWCMSKLLDGIQVCNAT